MNVQRKVIYSCMEKNKLSDVATFTTGKLNSNAAIENGIYPFFTCSPETLKINTFAFDQEAILLAGNNAEGNFCIKYYNGKFNAYQRTYVISNKKNKTDLKYLFYALKLCLQQFKFISQGTATKFLTAKILNNFEITIPSLSVQSKISAFLSSLDNKIEINNRINENLAKQIQTLCNAWLNNYVPFGGICPDDWELTPLSSFARFIGGYSYKGNELQPSSIAMATIKNFDRKGGFKLDGYKEIVPSSKLKPEHHASLFDTLVAHTDLTQNAEVIGNAELVLSFSGYEDIIFSMDVVKVVPNNPSISKFLIAAMLQTQQFKEHCLGYVNGTTVLHLSKKALSEYSVMLPKDIRVLKPLDDAVSSMYQQMALNIDECVQLTKLRDTMLPLLMSGALDVSALDL